MFEDIQTTLSFPAELRMTLEDKPIVTEHMFDPLPEDEDWDALLEAELNFLFPDLKED